MTAKRKHLSVVSIEDITPEPNAPMPVPSAPVLDERATYIADQQDILAKAESDLWIIDNDDKANDEDEVRQIDAIRRNKLAVRQQLQARRAMVLAVKAGAQAAICAASDAEQGRAAE